MTLDMDTRELPAGTMVHIAGIPCFLTAPAILETGRGNWRAIDKLEASENQRIETMNESIVEEPETDALVIEPVTVRGSFTLAQEPDEVCRTGEQLLASIQRQLDLSPIAEVIVKRLSSREAEAPRSATDGSR